SRRHRGDRALTACGRVVSACEAPGSESEVASCNTAVVGASAVAPGTSLARGRSMIRVALAMIVALAACSGGGNADVGADAAAKFGVACTNAAYDPCTSNDQ